MRRSPSKKITRHKPENFQSQSRRANAEWLRILQRKRWRLYFWATERKIAQELYQYHASCSSVLLGGMADTSEYQRG